MFVESLLPAARERLVTIADDAPLIEVATLLHTGTDLVVVCNASGVLVGVITKTDIVRHVSQCQGAGCVIAASLAMTCDIASCRPGDPLQDVWARMKERDLKNLPVVGPDLRPLGTLNARDVLQVLLKDSKYEEAMLRDYVMGLGYR